MRPERGIIHDYQPGGGGRSDRCATAVVRIIRRMRVKKFTTRDFEDTDASIAMMTVLEGYLLGFSNIKICLDLNSICKKKLIDLIGK